MVYVRVQQEPGRTPACGGLDKPDSMCRLPDVFPAMAHKIQSSVRDIVLFGNGFFLWHGPCKAIRDQLTDCGEIEP